LNSFASVERAAAAASSSKQQQQQAAAAAAAAVVAGSIRCFLDGWRVFITAFQFIKYSNQSLDSLRD
jgi:hypothetical protein